MEWIVSLVTALLQTIHALWTPEGKAAMQAVGLGGALHMSPEEKAAYLIHGPARAQVLSEEEAGSNTTTSASRDWMRCLRDCSYSIFALFSIHAPAAFYPNEALKRMRGVVIGAPSVHGSETRATGGPRGSETNHGSVPRGASRVVASEARESAVRVPARSLICGMDGHKGGERDEDDG